MTEHLAADVGDAGDTAARLFDDHADRLVGLACLLLRDRAEAEDVVQEAFLRLQRNASTIREPGREAAYLRATMLNLARSRLRHRRVAERKGPPLSPDGAEPGEVVEQRDEQRRMIEALRRLPARQRECLVLRYFEDLSDADVAETLGLSIASVRTHVRRGKAKLQKGLR